MRAVEKLIFDGVRVNVTLLLSREHCLAAAEAYLRGIERRLAAGPEPKAASVASVFVSRWDVSVKEDISTPLHKRRGVAMPMRTYRAHREQLAFSDHGQLGAAMPADGGHAEAVLEEFRREGVDDDALVQRAT